MLSRLNRNAIFTFSRSPLRRFAKSPSSHRRQDQGSGAGQPVGKGTVGRTRKRGLKHSACLVRMRKCVMIHCSLSKGSPLERALAAMVKPEIFNFYL
jgi:hypothetical protein